MTESPNIQQDICLPRHLITCLLHHTQRPKDQHHREALLLLSFCARVALRLRAHSLIWATWPSLACLLLRGPDYSGESLPEQPSDRSCAVSACSDLLQKIK